MSFAVFFCFDLWCICSIIEVFSLLSMFQLLILCILLMHTHILFCYFTYSFMHICLTCEVRYFYFRTLSTESFRFYLHLKKICCVMHYILQHTLELFNVCWFYIFFVNLLIICIFFLSSSSFSPNPTHKERKSVIF